MPQPPDRCNHARSKTTFQGEPRPDNAPSSEAASVKAIETPAPSAAANPTKNVVCEFWVAKAVAKIGASVETDPSI